MPEEKIISVKNLSKHYGDFHAVDNLSFSVNKGDIYGFLGPNGAGKSTTIRMMVSLIYPTSGEIEIFGKSITENRMSVLSNIGCLIERPDFYGNLSALANLKILASVTNLKRSKKDFLVLLDLVGLNGKEDQKVKTFSQGMKQRLGLAQALMHNPDLLILDEPSNGLDPQGIRDMRELLIRVNKEQGKTILLSSHLLDEMELMANRMVIINKGKNVVEGDMKSLLTEATLPIQIDSDNSSLVIELITRAGFKAEINITDPGLVTAYLKKLEISGVNKLLVNAGVSVSSIRTVKTLEEYFFSKT